jgi:uncharacterized protein
MSCEAAVVTAVPQTRRMRQDRAAANRSDRAAADLTGSDVDTVCMRITIRVKPGSARPNVGGEHDGALIVRVSARAVDGRATEAALTAVADSFGVSRSAVRMVAGASSRTKVVDIDADDPRLLASLLATPGRLPVTRYRSRPAVDHERSQGHGKVLLQAA